MKTYRTKSGGRERVLREPSPPPEEWFSEILEEEDQFNICLSGKLVLLCEILKRSELFGDKVLLFSQSLMTLTLIEDTLAMMTEAKNSNWKVCI